MNLKVVAYSIREMRKPGDGKSAKVLLGMYEKPKGRVTGVQSSGQWRTMDPNILNY